MNYGEFQISKDQKLFCLIKKIYNKKDLKPNKKGGNKKKTKKFVKHATLNSANTIRSGQSKRFRSPLSNHLRSTGRC